MPSIAAVVIIDGWGENKKPHPFTAQLPTPEESTVLNVDDFAATGEHPINA